MTAAVAGRGARRGEANVSADAAGAANRPQIAASRVENRLELALSGDWTLEMADALDALRGTVPDLEAGSGVETVSVDLGPLGRLDTTGAWIIKRKVDELTASGARVSFANAPRDSLELLKSVAFCAPDTEVERARVPLAIEIAERTGQATLRFLAEVTQLTGFFGLIVKRLWLLARRPSRLRLTSIQFHIEATGLNAIPIVALLSFLVGIVIAYQGALQLRQFGADIYTIDLLGFSILRELGPLVTAIIVAGRSGSAFAAQIGTMKVNEEVDAMRTMGLDVIEYLVIPRIVALMITLPLLVFMANLVAILGGAFVSRVALDIDFGTFLLRLRDSVDTVQLFVGLVKTPVFAFVIAMVGCYEGLKVGGSAQSVGEKTTNAVVESIFLVIVIDAGFSILFAFLGI